MRRIIIITTLLCGSGGWVWGQVPTAPPVPVAPEGYVVQPVAPPAVVTAPRWTDAQIDQVMASIALYPDPLLAQMMPAATAPMEVATAAAWVRSYPAVTEEMIQVQPWQAPVKALVHYPSVLQMMADRPEWTQQLGYAFATQQADVMASVQRLRGAALAAGTLVSGPQQQVLVSGGVIQVVPVQPTVMYVPSYDPNVVYVRRAWSAPPVVFSAGVGIGGWLNLDFDWRSRIVVTGRHWEDPRRVVVERPWHPEVGRPVIVYPRGPVVEQRGYGGHDYGHPFGPYDRRDEIEHDERRGHDSMHH